MSFVNTPINYAHIIVNAKDDECNMALDRVQISIPEILKNNNFLEVMTIVFDERGLIVAEKSGEEHQVELHGLKAQRPENYSVNLLYSGIYQDRVIGHEAFARKSIKCNNQRIDLLQEVQIIGDISSFLNDMKHNGQDILYDHAWCSRETLGNLNSVYQLMIENRKDGTLMDGAYLGEMEIIPFITKHQHKTLHQWAKAFPGE